MDIYTSHRVRDDSLSYHPDYDYYERDRNACRPSSCSDCAVKPIGPSAIDHYRPTTYRPPTDFKPTYNNGPDSTYYGHRPDDYRPYDARPTYENRPPPSYDSRPPPAYDNRPPPSYDNRPPPPSYDNRPSVFEYMDRDDSYGPPSGYRPSSYDLDRYDKPVEIARPGYQEVIIPVNNPGYSPPTNKRPYDKDDHRRPDSYIRIEDYRYDYKPNRYNEYMDDYRPDYISSYSVTGYRPAPHQSYPPPGPSIYLDRDPPPPAPPPMIGQHKPSGYLPDDNKDMYSGSYGGRYGSSGTNQYTSDYWGLKKNIQRKDDQHFNYFELGGSKYGPSGLDNSIWSYPGSKYNNDDRNWFKDKKNEGTGNMWTRRPSQDGWF